MPQIEISKIKLRRGNNDQRKHVIFDQGEIVSTTDTKRVYIGTGTLSGGFAVGSKNFIPLSNYTSLSTVIAEVGDLINVNNKFYQLTSVNYSNLSNWADVGVRVDPILFRYTPTNSVTIVTGSISSIYLNSETISNGLHISGGVLQANINTKCLEISALQLSIKASGIDEREIKNTALSYGLLGGSGSKLYLDVDPTYFYFSGNKLSLSAAPLSLEFTDLSSSWFGDGLYYDSGQTEIRAILTDVDNSTIIKNGAGVISLKSPILDVLTGNAALSNLNYNNSLSAIYNGDSMGLSAIRITTFTALSSDGTTIITLSSAGFITFAGNTTTVNGTTIGRYAIPIYRY